MGEGLRNLILFAARLLLQAEPRIMYSLALGQLGQSGQISFRGKENVNPNGRLKLRSSRPRPGPFMAPRPGLPVASPPDLESGVVTNVFRHPHLIDHYKTPR